MLDFKLRILYEMGCRIRVASLSVQTSVVEFEMGVVSYKKNFWWLGKAMFYVSLRTVSYSHRCSFLDIIHYNYSR